jgi:hypothetical protein
MKKFNIYIILGIIALFALFAMDKKEAITCNEMLQLNAPNTVSPGAEFSLDLLTVGASGSWGGSVELQLNGCNINGATSKTLVLVSDLPNPLTYKVQTSSSGTACTMTGTVMYGNCAIKPFSKTVTLSTIQVCTYGSWSAWSDAVNNCGTRTRTSSSPSCTATTETLSCQGTCTDSSWTPNQNTVCSGSSFTQTSNCGNTRQQVGTKDCSACVDSSWSPQVTTICSNVTVQQTSNCGNTRIVLGEKNCGGSSPNNTTDDFDISKYLPYIIFGFIAVFMIAMVK